MNRLISINFHEEPIHAKLAVTAEPNYKGYFHYHPGIELLYVHGGEGNVILDQNVFGMEPGTLFLFQPYQLHYVKASTDSAQYVRSILHFEPNTVMSALQSFGGLTTGLKRIWKEQLPTHVFRRFGNRHPMEPLLSYYGRQLADSSPDVRRTLSTALLTQLLVFLESEVALPPDESQLFSRSVTHAEAIMEWIEAHYSCPFKLDELAGELHLSKYHVSHLFREETGHSVTDYLLARRVQEACRLLTTTDLSIEAVGARVGWPVPSHFSSQFRKWAGCTPTQYRSRSAALAPTAAEVPI